MVDLNVILGKRRLLPAAAAVLALSASLLLSGCESRNGADSVAVEKAAAMQSKEQLLGIWRRVPGGSGEMPEFLQITRNGEIMIVRLRVGRDNFILTATPEGGHWFVHLPSKGMGGSSPLVIEQETGRLLFGGVAYERYRPQPAAPAQGR